MAQYNETRSKSFPVSAALKAKRLVRLVAGELAYAAADSADAIGFTTKETFAQGEHTPVDLLNMQGTTIGEAAGAFASGAELFQAADGKIDDAGTIRVGIAFAESGADGDWVEILPLPQPSTV